MGVSASSVPTAIVRRLLQRKIMYAHNATMSALMSELTSLMA